MTDYPIHPACAVWPSMSDLSFEELVASIRERGLIHPIMLCEGKILDGKERHRACVAAGIEPKYETYSGADPVGFSLDVNKHRRHLPAYELAFIGEELAKIKRGGNRGNQYTGKVLGNTLPNKLDTVQEIANQLGIGRQSILSARALRRHAEPNIIEMAKTGKVGIQSAGVYATQTPRKEQRDANIATVRQLGSFQRHHKDRPGKAAKSEQMITIPYEDVIGKLHPLIKRVKEQSDRHAATVSFMALRIIAFELKQLADSWMKNGTEPGTHSAPVSLNCVQKGR